MGDLPGLTKRSTKNVPWYVRFLSRLGLVPGSHAARMAVAGTSKHRRGKKYRHGNKRHKKIRRKMAAESRRINRRRV